MIAIIVFSCLSIPLYIVSLATDWYYWSSSSYISSWSTNVLKFSWSEAKYKIDLTQTIKFKYYGDLKNTFTITPILLGIGFLFSVLTFVLAIIYQKVGKRRKNHCCFVIRAITLPLQFVFTVTAFFYFYKSFMDNVRKDIWFCGLNSMFALALNINVNNNVRLPAYCDRKFYKTYQLLSSDPDAQTSIPGPGYWVCLGVLIFCLVQIIVALSVKYKVNKEKKHHQTANTNLNFIHRTYVHEKKPHFNVYNENDFQADIKKEEVVRDNDPRFYRNEVDDDVNVNNNIYNNNNNNNNNNINYIDNIQPVQIEMNNLQKSAYDPGNV